MDNDFPLHLPSSITLGDMELRRKNLAYIDNNSVVYWWCSAQHTCNIGYRIMADGSRSVCLLGTRTAPPLDVAQAISLVFFPDESVISEYAQINPSIPPMMVMRGAGQSSALICSATATN